jgi:hypothetical protein
MLSHNQIVIGCSCCVRLKKYDEFSTLLLMIISQKWMTVIHGRWAGLEMTDYRNPVLAIPFNVSGEEE